MGAPVLFMIFNRPELTRASFERIRQARPPRLYVEADGPRPGKADDERLCREARAIATAVDWPCEVKTLFRGRNLGVRMACTGGISWFFQHEPEGIILEDDCVPHPDFFPFCAELLERYRDAPEVMLIGGSNYQYGKKRGEASYYFSIYPHIWGWAAWRRVWRLYDIEMQGMERFIKTRMPGIMGHHGAFIAMMRKFMLIKENVDMGWDFQLVYSIWRHGGLSVIPNANMVGNIGRVEDSAHPWRPDVADYRPVQGLGELTHPAAPERCKAADDFHSEMLATEYGGRVEALAREIATRASDGDRPAALELLRVSLALYGAEHPAFAPFASMLRS